MDVDGDGIISTSEFLQLAKRTITRAQRAAEAGASATTPLSPTTEITRLFSYQEKKSSVSKTKHAGGKAWGRQSLDMAGKVAMARLEAADPHRLGGITFSECVEHLAADIAAGTTTEPAKEGVHPGRGRDF